MPLINSESLVQTTAVAKEWLAALKPGQAATVVALLGDLGSGKTTFTQAVARELGVSENVTSPTFVIQKIYHLTGQKFQHLVHIDCYRLDSPDELARLGWQELLSNSTNLILVEWADRVAPLLPPNHREIKFKFIDENTREIKY